VERRFGISVADLPPMIQTMCNDICSRLDLQNRDQGRPTLQSIEYRYPHIQVSFNCPLSYHSAHLIIDAQVSPAGEVQSCELEVQFFAPEGIADYDRGVYLTKYVLSTYYSWQGQIPMKAPLNAPMEKPTSPAVSFKWQIYPIEADSQKYWETAMKHIQVQINTLQTGSELPNRVTEEMVKNNLWVTELYVRLRRWGNESEQKIVLNGGA
jgi:hypothetical protein